MYTVKVTFRGLCAFVPSDATTTPAWVGAFLVDADENSRERFGLNLNPHYSFLQFKWKDVEGLALPPDDLEDLGLWSLQSKDIVFVRQNPTGGPVTIHRAPTGTLGDFPRPGEEQFFDWVPQADEVAPGAGVMDSDCFSATPSGRVNVRIHLSEGKIISDALGEYENNLVLSQFDPPRVPAPNPRAMARRIGLVMENVERSFKVRARKFGSANVRELIFKDPGVGNTLELTVLNICMDDLMEDPARRRRYPVVDRDYRWYYTLSLPAGSSVPESLPVPVPVQFRVSSGTGGGEPAQCTSSGYRPPTSAQVAAMQTIARDIS